MLQPQQTNGNGMQYQLQSMRSADPSSRDGPLQYDSSSFPLLSSNRFSGQPMQRDEGYDFIIQNEDFPALPGSLSTQDRINQKQHDDRNTLMSQNGMSSMNTGMREISREISQETLQQQQLLLQQQLRIQTQNQITNQVQNQVQGLGQGPSIGPTVSRGLLGGNNLGGISLGMNASTVGNSINNTIGNSNQNNPNGQNGSQNGSLIGSQNGDLIGINGNGLNGNNGNGVNNSMSSSFLGIGMSGGISGILGGQSVSSVGSVVSKEGRYGLLGLLDVIRMTDKVNGTLYLFTVLLYALLSSPSRTLPLSKYIHIRNLCATSATTSLPVCYFKSSSTAVILSRRGIDVCLLPIQYSVDAACSS